MSCLMLTLYVDNAAAGKAIGIKEAIAMDLEKYGDVRVLRVDVQEPEQLGLPGAAPPPAKAASGQAPAVAPPPRRGRAPKTTMRCCMSCREYRPGPGRDQDGALYRGLCAHTGKPVYWLADRCRAWKGCG